MLTNALSHSPFCVFLSFGDPGPFAVQIHEAGAALICQVQFLSQIEMALKAGATAVVVQGTEAGGHGASRSTLPFVPEAADYLKRHSPETLLLAAAGIVDGRGLAAALMLGADGVVVGTRLWASVEALTPKAHTDKAIGETGDSTIRTKVLDALRGVPWPREYSFRFMKNKSDPSKEVRCRLQSDPKGRIVMTVTDPGPGFSPEALSDPKRGRTFMPTTDAAFT